MSEQSIRSGTDSQSVARVLSIIATMLAVFVAVIVPFVFCAVCERYERAELVTDLRVAADALARVLDNPAELSSIDSSGLVRLLQGAEPLRQPTRYELVDGDGRTVIERSPPLTWPTMTEAMPVTVRGAALGVLVAERSLVPVLVRTLWAASFGVMIGVAMLLTLRLLPLRLLNEVIAQLESSHERLTEALDRAQAGSRSKSEFLATMSHELRTPLNAIIGFSDIMAREMFGPQNPRYRAYAQDILQSGRHLLTLVNDILDFSKLDAGKLALSEDATEVRDVVVQAVKMVEGRAAEAGIAIALSLPPALPALYGDERRLRQVLLNLLSNAVKFTPDGGNVTVSAERESDHLCIEVRDNGIGIAPQDITRAMTPFEQIESGHERRFEGTGLGLPLAKRLVELHDGVFEIASEPGAGTTVRLLFPATRLIEIGAPVSAVS
jgi:signal transduction histidine kinase